jgi:hypothetical protein
LWGIRVGRRSKEIIKAVLSILYIKKLMTSIHTNYKILLLFLFSCCFIGRSSSQTLVFDNIKKLNLINQGVIKAGDDINGYFFVYEKDTIDNYSNTYKLVTTSNKLKVIKEAEIIVPQETTIFESSSNGTEVVLLFLNSDTKTFEYDVFDLTGNKKFSYTRKLSRKEFRQYEDLSLAGIDNSDIKSFYAIDSIGFISKTIREEKKILSISIDFYGSKENKQWSYVPTIGASYFFGQYLGVYKEVVYIHLVSFKVSLHAEKPETFIVGLDLKTGKELFKKSADAKYKILAKGIKTLNDGGGYLYGAYYALNANLMKDKPAGFALWKIKENGDLIEEKYVSFQNDFSEHLNVLSTGKIQGLGSIYFHNIVQTAKGDLYILGEGYRKVMNTAVILKAALFGVISILGENLRKEVSTDMILIKLDSTYKIENLKIYNKENTPFFCYNYTQENIASQSFGFWYFSNRVNVLNSISVHDDKITSEQIKINPKTSRLMVLPATNGQILLLDYFRITKKMELHFDVFNNN